MANNPQFAGGPGPPHHSSMLGSVGAPQNIPPSMQSQFRSVGSVHPPQQYAHSPSQQYHHLGPGMHTSNLAMAPQSQQIQFAQQMQQSPARPMVPGQPPQMSQLSNIQSNRPMSSGFPQPVQNLQAPSSFVPASGGPGISHPPTYMSNTFSTPQYQTMSQMNPQGNSVPGQHMETPGNMGAPPVTPSQLSGQLSAPMLQAFDSLVRNVEHSSSDWLEHTNNGRKFYYNKKTRQSTWEKPIELMNPRERADATTDWKEFVSSDGRKYYYNKATKQSKWTIPEDLKLAREQVERVSHSAEAIGNTHASVSASLSDVRQTYSIDAKSAAVVVSSSPAAVTPVAGATSPPSPSSHELGVLSGSDCTEAPTDAVKVQSPAVKPSIDVADPVTLATSADTSTSPTKESNTVQVEKAVDSQPDAVSQESEGADNSMEVGGKANVTTSAVIERESQTYASKQEAKEAFKALLDSANVESDWTWEQVMRLIINDKRYAALKSLGERKQAFNEYLSLKRKQETEDRRAKHKKAKEDFWKMLEECNELTSASRWSKAISVFGDDERFKAVERARDRQDMFEEYLAELEKKELAKAEEERIRDIKEYRKFLESCDFIKANSQWRRVKDRLEADERCSRLETSDQLKIFQEYVDDLEKEEEEQRRIAKEESRKAERRNRDEFRKLLEEHVADGTLTAKISWRDYHLKVKDSPTYLAVSSNTSGCTPKELFEDVAEEQRIQYEEDRIRIKDAVKSEKVALSSTWTFEQFRGAIANEISSPEVSESNLKLVFEELLERAREREEKEAKRRKRLGDEFFNMLCLIEDITVDSNWEDCLPLFQDREEYRAIGEEAFSKQIFEEYLQQLKEKEKERKRREEKAKKEKERERDRRSKERRDKDRRHDRDRTKERMDKEEVDGEPDVNEFSVSNENRRSGKEKDRKHRRRHDEENDASLDKNGKDHFRSSHRHSSEHKRPRLHYDDMPESDSERHRKHKREHRNGSRKKGDNEELEDGELGNW